MKNRLLMSLMVTFFSLPTFAADYLVKIKYTAPQVFETIYNRLRKDMVSNTNTVLADLNCYLKEDMNFSTTKTLNTIFGGQYVKLEVSGEAFCPKQYSISGTVTESPEVKGDLAYSNVSVRDLKKRSPPTIYFFEGTTLNGQ